MWTRTARSWLIAPLLVIAVTAPTQVRAGSLSPVAERPDIDRFAQPAPHLRRTVSIPAEAVASPVPVSLTPHVTGRHGSATQHERLEVALARFRSTGLRLPDLAIVFLTDETECGGHMGQFIADADPWRIHLCDPADFVYEHELAHAWEAATLTDETRHEFMELRGYTTWDDPTFPWNEQGIEGVAFIIQQGLGGSSLPYTLSAEHRSRLEAFELLTGQQAPSLAEWARTQKTPSRSAPTGTSSKTLPHSGLRVSGSAGVV